MIKIPVEQIIEKIKEKSGLSDAEINSKIKSKMDQLAGLISKEGAAHIIANELGVKIIEEGKVKINKILSGMRSVETIGKVTNVYELREFQRKDGSPGKVASFFIADETGRIRIVLWNDQTDMIKDIKEGTIIGVKNGLARENNGNIEIHISNNSEVEINPEGEKIENVVERQQANRKKIEELTGNDNNVELMATIVQIFEPRFYEVCPECNKRIRQKEDGFTCEVHGKVEPSYAYVMNITLDDGTGTIRTAFFKNQTTNLLQIDEKEILKFKDNPGDFQTVKDDLTGKIIKVIGRTQKNEMFDRVEFVAQLVFPNPDPDQELKKLEEEAKVIE